MLNGNGANGLGELFPVGGGAVLPDGVRAWRLSLDGAEERAALYLPSLARDEHERAARYRTARVRDRFILVRGVLRTLLSDLTGVAPDRLVLSYGRDGKPSLVASAGHERPHFNLSHARDVAVFVTSRDRPVGVDVEWVHGATSHDRIVERFFSARERLALEAMDAEERRAAFHRVWVRKEAYLKGRGEGISERIHDTDFAWAPEVAAGGAEPNGRPQEGRGHRWLVADLAALPDGYVASVAVEHRAP